MTRNSKPHAKIPLMPPHKKARRLETHRLVALIEQRAKQTGHSFRRICADIGIDPTLPSKLAGDLTRNVDNDTLENAIEATGIDRRYFEDKTLGPNPDYRAFLPPSSPLLQNRPRLRKSRELPVEATPSGMNDSVEEALRQMHATPAERAEFLSLLEVYRFPFPNGSLATAFMVGLRKNVPRHERIDAALAASILEEDAKQRGDASKEASSVGTDVRQGVREPVSDDDDDL